MAIKTNFETNGYRYYKVTKTIGHSISGEPIKKVFYGKSKSEAEQKAIEYIELNVRGITNLENASLGYLINDWLWNVRRNSKKFKSSSFDRYERIVRVQIIPSEISKCLIQNISPQMIQRYYSKLYSKGYSQSKIENLNKVLSTFFNYCKTQGWISINPASKELIELPGESDVTIDDTDEDIKIFNDKQRLEIINAAKQTNDSRLTTIHTIILLAIATGMRVGEILGLQPKYLDLENKEIKVRKTLEKINLYDENNKIIGSELKLIDPKSKKSVRIIPLPDFIIPILRNYHFGNAVIFETNTGNFIDPRNIDRAWERFLRRHCIPYLKFHALRHTYASLLFKEGATLKEVQELLGHADLKTTEKIYISTMPEDKIRRVTQINKLFV